MADGDRPIVLVPLATARKAARRAGVTLNLSVEDIQLAGKWKHGWIPLDAVASAVKAKRYHGGGGEGRTVRGKGRAGSAVESRREPSRGRTKGALPTHGRTFSDAGDTTVSRREHGLPTGGRKAAKANPVGSKLEHSEPKYVTPRVARAPEGPRRERAAKSVLPAAGKPSLERVSAKDLRPGDVLKSWRGGGKSDVGSAMGGRRVVGVEHRRGFAHVKLDSGFEVRLRHEDGTADRVASERGAATARAQQTAQDRTRRVGAARGEPKLADLSDADLQALIARYGDRSVQADAARAEMLRRSGGSAVVSHPSITGQQVNPGDKVAFGKSGRDRWTVRRHLPAGKVHLQSEHLSSRGVGHGQATRTVDSSRLRHLSSPAETAPTGHPTSGHSALSHEERQTLSREQESLARANAIDRRSGAGKAGRLDETIKARERRIREIKRTLDKGAK